MTERFGRIGARIGVFLLGLLVVSGALAGATPTSVSQPTITYFHNDISGSPLLATDAAGNVVWKENYRPYGERLNNQVVLSNLTIAPKSSVQTSGISTARASIPLPPTNSVANNLWFAGKSFDPNTGLYYMGARYYDPVTGRFMGADPAAVKPGDPHGFNRYAYANNNPYKFVDPDGHSPIDVAFLAYDLGKLGMALYSGSGRGEAAIGVALSAVGVISPIVGTGEVLKAARAVERAANLADRAVGIGKAAEGAKEAATVIGRVKDLKNLGAGEKSLLERLPNLGESKTNWKQNAGVLREEMRRGMPIRDASPGDTAGQFLNAERDLLSGRGWTFDPHSNYWIPPAP